MLLCKLQKSGFRYHINHVYIGALTYDEDKKRYVLNLGNQFIIMNL